MMLRPKLCFRMTAPAAPMKPEEKAPPPISDYRKPGSIISVRDLGWMRRSWPALSHWTNDLGMTIPGRDLRPSLSRSVRDRAGDRKSVVQGRGHGPAGHRRGEDRQARRGEGGHAAGRGSE